MTPEPAAHSIGQTESHVNPPSVYYYSVPILPSVQAGRSKRTPEQARADNKLAAELRAQDAEVQQGPRIVGRAILIPSWRWMPEAVREWKRLGGRFYREHAFTRTLTVHGQAFTVTVTLDVWMVDARRAKLAEVDAFYRRIFCKDLARIEMSAQLNALERF